jgi:thioredoxin-like negative regulator of GroEL
MSIARSSCARHEPSKPQGQMDAVWTQLAALHAHEGIRFLKVEAEAVPSVSENYELSVVPTFVLLEAGQKVAVIEGADPPVLAKQVQAFAASKPAAPASDTDAAAISDLTGRLNKVSYYCSSASLNMHTSCFRYSDCPLC